MSKISVRRHIKRGICIYSSFFLLLLTSCGTDSSVNIGFDKKFSLSQNEKQQPITITSLNNFQDLVHNFNHSAALNHLIKSPNYIIFLGVSIDEGSKISDLSLNNSSRSLVIDMNQEADKKYFLKHKDEYGYITFKEAKNLILLAMISKDSSLIRKLYEDDYLQRKLD